MDGSFTDYKAHQWLQEIADNAWVSLHYDTPALGGIGACEIAGGGYRRVQAMFSQPANRSIWTVEDVRYVGLTQNVLTHFGIWDATDLGNLLAYGRLPDKVSVLNGWGYALNAGELAVSIG